MPCSNASPEQCRSVWWETGQKWECFCSSHMAVTRHVCVYPLWCVMRGICLVLSYLSLLRAPVDALVVHNQPHSYQPDTPDQLSFQLLCAAKRRAASVHTIHRRQKHHHRLSVGLSACVCVCVCLYVLCRVSTTQAEDLNGNAWGALGGQQALASIHLCVMCVWEVGYCCCLITACGKACCCSTHRSTWSM